MAEVPGTEPLLSWRLRKSRPRAAIFIPRLTATPFISASSGIVAGFPHAEMTRRCVALDEKPKPGGLPILIEAKSATLLGEHHQSDHGRETVVRTAQASNPARQCDLLSGSG